MIKSFLNEFKTFVSRGNVIDMAVGIIIGTAFGKIISSLVADVLMPPIGMILGNIDFSSWFVVLKHGSDASATYLSLDAAKSAGAITLNIGFFLNNIISFVIIAFALFSVLKVVNKLDRNKNQAPVTTKECPFCCSVINLNAKRCPNCTSELA